MTNTTTDVAIANRRYKVTLCPPSGIYSRDFDQTADQVADILDTYKHLVSIGAIAPGEALEIKRTT